MYSQKELDLKEFQDFILSNLESIQTKDSPKITEIASSISRAHHSQLIKSLFDIVHQSKNSNDPIKIKRSSIAISILAKAKIPFSGLDLSGIHIQNADLRHALFHKSNLTDAKLLGCDVFGAEFSGSILRRTDFSNAKFSLEPSELTLESIKNTDTPLISSNRGYEAKKILGAAGRQKIEVNFGKGKRIISIAPSISQVNIVKVLDGKMPAVFVQSHFSAHIYDMRTGKVKKSFQGTTVQNDGKLMRYNGQNHIGTFQYERLGFTQLAPYKVIYETNVKEVPILLIFAVASNYLAYCVDRSQLILIDLQTKQLINTLKLDLKVSYALSIQFFPDGSKFFFSQIWGCIDLYDTKSLKKISSIKGVFNSQFRPFFTSPDEKYTFLNIFGAQVPVLCTSNGEILYNYTFQRNGSLLSQRVGDQFKNHRYFFIGTEKKLFDFSFDKFYFKDQNDHQAAVTAIYAPKNGKYLFTGDSKGCIKLWNITENIFVKNICNDHKSKIKSLKSSHDGFLLISVSSEVLKVWKIQDSNVECVFEQASQEGFNSAEFADEKNECIIGCEQFQIFRYNITELSKFEMKVKKSSNPMVGIAKKNNIQDYFVHKSQFVVQAWSLKDGKKELTKFHTFPKADEFLGIELHPDESQKSVLVYWKDELHVLDTFTLQSKLKISLGVFGSILSCRYIKEGNQIFCVLSNGNIVFVDSKSGKIVKRFSGIDEKLESCYITEDLCTIYLGSCGGIIAKLCRNESGEYIMDWITGVTRDAKFEGVIIEDPIMDFAFSKVHL